MGAYRIYDERDHITTDTLMISRSNLNGQEIQTVKSVMEEVREQTATGQLDIPLIRIKHDNYSAHLIEDSEEGFRIVQEERNRSIELRRLVRDYFENTKQINDTSLENTLDQINNLIQEIDVDYTIIHEEISDYLVKHAEDISIHSIAEIDAIGGIDDLAERLFSHTISRDRLKQFILAIFSDLENHLNRSSGSMIQDIYVRSIVRVMRDWDITVQRILYDKIVDNVINTNLKFDVTTIQAIIYYRDGLFEKAIKILEELEEQTFEASDKSQTEHSNHEIHDEANFINKMILNGDQLFVFNNLLIKLLKRRMKIRAGLVEDLENNQDQIFSGLQEAGVAITNRFMVEILGIAILEGFEDVIPEIMQIIHNPNTTIEIGKLVRGLSTLNQNNYNQLSDYLQTNILEDDAWKVVTQVILADLADTFGEIEEALNRSNQVIDLLDDLQPKDVFFIETVTNPEINHTLRNSRYNLKPSEAFAIALRIQSQNTEISLTHDGLINLYGNYVTKYSTIESILSSYQIQGDYYYTHSYYASAISSYTKAKVLNELEDSNNFTGTFDLVRSYLVNGSLSKANNEIDTIVSGQSISSSKSDYYEAKILQARVKLVSGKLKQYQSIIDSLQDLDNQTLPDDLKVEYELLMIKHHYKMDNTIPVSYKDTLEQSSDTYKILRIMNQIKKSSKVKSLFSSIEKIDNIVKTPKNEHEINVLYALNLEQLLHLLNHSSKSINHDLLQQIVDYIYHQSNQIEANIAVLVFRIILYRIMKDQGLEIDDTFMKSLKTISYETDHDYENSAIMNHPKRYLRLLTINEVFRSNISIEDAEWIVLRNEEPNNYERMREMQDILQNEDFETFDQVYAQFIDNIKKEERDLMGLPSGSPMWKETVASGIPKILLMSSVDINTTTNRFLDNYSDYENQFDRLIEKAAYFQLVLNFTSLYQAKNTNEQWIIQRKQRLLAFIEELQNSKTNLDQQVQQILRKIIFGSQFTLYRTIRLIIMYGITCEALGDRDGFAYTIDIIEEKIRNNEITGYSKWNAMLINTINRTSFSMLQTPDQLQMLLKGVKEIITEVRSVGTYFTNLYLIIARALLRLYPVEEAINKFTTIVDQNVADYKKEIVHLQFDMAVARIKGKYEDFYRKTEKFYHLVTNTDIKQTDKFKYAVGLIKSFLRLNKSKKEYRAEVDQIMKKDNILSRSFYSLIWDFYSIDSIEQMNILDLKLQKIKGKYQIFIEKSLIDLYIEKFYAIAIEQEKVSIFIEMVKRKITHVEDNTSINTLIYKLVANYRLHKLGYDIEFNLSHTELTLMHELKNNNLYLLRDYETIKIITEILQDDDIYYLYEQLLKSEQKG